MLFTDKNPKALKNKPYKDGIMDARINMSIICIYMLFTNQNPKALKNKPYKDGIYGHIKRAETIVRIEEQEIPQRNFFRYLGSIISINGEIDEDVNIG